MKPSLNFFNRLRRQFSRYRGYKDSEDDGFFIAGESISRPRDRSQASFRDVIDSSLRAWREDPLGRRIVSLTTQFSIGRGFRINADDPAADELICTFWNHPLNHMDARLTEWSDELCRTGNLFIMLSSDISGMSYVRAIPAGMIEEIVPLENDIEQPKFFKVRDYYDTNEMRIPEQRIIYPADAEDPDSGERMLHFTVNRPVGAQWGESDLAPILVWMDRYNGWLENRALLNKYRTCFLFTVKAGGSNEYTRQQRQFQLNRIPPTPGTIMVTPADEEWSVIHPNFDSSDANEDGLAIKKMIAAGVGIPVTFLAESASTSLAESGGMEDSACRNFRQRQQTLMWITETVLRNVLARASLVREDIDPHSVIHVCGDDIAAPGMTEGGIMHEA